MPARQPVVVLIHSLGGSPAQWAPQVSHLAPNHESLAVTLPGHAGRPDPEAYTIEALAEDVAGQIDELGDVVVIGHSAGSLVAIHLAARHPDRVAGLLLVDPGTDGRQFPREQAEPMLAALRSEAYTEVARDYWSHLLTGATDATRQRAMDDLRAASPAALPGVLAALQDFDAVTPLREVATSVPVLAVTTPLSDGEHALATVSDEIEVERVDGTSHWVQLDRQDVVNAALDRLLGRVG